MQRTLKRELKVLEIVKREAIEAPTFHNQLRRSGRHSVRRGSLSPSGQVASGGVDGSREGQLFRGSFTLFLLRGLFKGAISLLGDHDGCTFRPGRASFGSSKNDPSRGGREIHDPRGSSSFLS